MIQITVRAEGSKFLVVAINKAHNYSAIIHEIEHDGTTIGMMEAQQTANRKADALLENYKRASVTVEIITENVAQEEKTERRRKVA